MSVTVQNNQTLIDVAMQATGTADTAFGLALAQGISITSDLIAGTAIDTPLPDTQYKRISQLLSLPHLLVASGGESAQATGRGIGFWRIGLDFTIQ